MTGYICYYTLRKQKPERSEKINPITEQLYEETYMFCYKRLNNPTDAEDLAQDIIYEA